MVVLAEALTKTRLASVAIALAEVKNGRGVILRAHAANGDSLHYPAEHIKLSGPHVAVEEIVHVGVSDEFCEGVTPGNFLYERSGQAGSRSPRK